MMKPTAIIIGAGTAGLAAHLALRIHGYEVHHYERKATVEERGGNLAIWPNGGLVLREYGAGEALAAIGGAPAGFSTYDMVGELVSRVDFGPIADRMGMPMIMVPRAHFHGFLSDTVGRNAIQMGVSCTGVEQDESSVSVSLDDGHIDTADVLIAADGVRSVVRPGIAGETELRQVGITIWTGWMRDDGFLNDVSPNPDSMVEFWGPGQRMVFMPSGRNHMGFTFVMRVPDDIEVPDPQSWLYERFAGYPATARKVLARLRSEQIIRWQVYDIPPLARWTVGRIALVGDAAHAASPTLGQGAGMALEDSYVLAQCLSDLDGPVPDRLAEFERLRKPRAELLSEESRQRSLASTETDPERLAAIQAAVRGGDQWSLLKGIMDIVTGGPLN